MKKVIIGCLFTFLASSYSQAQEKEKFQLGVSYSLTGDEEFFKTPISGNAQLQLKKWDKLDVSVGGRVFQFASKEKKYFDNRWGYNPYLSASHHFANTKFSGYCALGYYFDKSVYKQQPFGNIIINIPDQLIKTKGITLTPGIKYFVDTNFFIDTNLSLLMATTKYQSGVSESNTTLYLNIGVGVAF